MEQCFERAEAADSRETPEARAAKPEIKYPQKVSIRPATDADLPLLAGWLASQTYFEIVCLPQMIVYVAEFEGKIVGFGAARLIFQIEPIFLEPTFKRHAPHFARARATLGLIRALEGWIADRRQNTTGIYSYFCFIKGRVMQKLAEAYGMWRIYRGGRFYGRDV
jgi:hypothetical protein